MQKGQTPADLSTPSSHQDILVAAKGGGILFFGRLLEEISQIIYTILVARSLGASGYGLYTLVISIALILATIAIMGLPQGMMRFLPIGISKRDDIRVRSTLIVGLGVSVIIGLSLSILLFILAQILAANIFHEPAATPILRLICIIIPLEAIGRVLMGAAIGLKQMAYWVYGYSIAFSLTRLGLAALFLYRGLDIPGVVTAYALAWFVTIGLLFYFLNQIVLFKGQKQISRDRLGELISFSAPLCLTEITLQLRGYVNFILIGVIGTMASVGVYSATARVQTAGNMLLEPITKVAKPIISDLDHQAELLRLERLYQTLTRWSLTFIFPLIIAIILFAKPILLIFGDEYVVGAPVLMIVSAGMLISAATRVCHSMISMTGYSKLTFYNTTASLVLNIIFNIILIPRWGIIGAAIATVLAIAIIGLARLVQVYWLVGIWPYNLTLGKPLAACAVAFLAGLLSKHILIADNNLVHFVFNILIIGSSYVGTTILLGLSEEDQTVLSHAGRRLNSVFSR